MNNAGTLEWLEENSYRAYPLQVGAANMFKLANNCYDIYAIILDANLVFNSLPASVTLDKLVITSAAGVTTLKLFISDQPLFTITINNSDTYYVRNTAGSLLAVNGKVINSWSGLNTFVKFSNLLFEPSTCLEVSQVYLGVSDILFGTTSVAGQNWTNGYQFSVAADGQTVQLEVGRNEGYPLPCANFLDKAGQLNCSQAVSNINGATPVTGGGTINIIAGEHVRVFNDPDKHTVYIGLDFVANDISTGTLTI